MEDGGLFIQRFAQAEGLQGAVDEYGQSQIIQPAKWLRAS
jgi:hypothetical protein